MNASVKPNLLKTKYDVCVIAHRGFNAKYPENTLLSFQKALEVGADYIELDVHNTKDGIVVVIHDSSTKRTGNAELIVEDHTLEEVEKIDVGQGQGFQKIPTLEEVFQLCKGKMGVQIEIKGHGVAPNVVELIKKYDMAKEVAISSFKHSELVTIKKLMPELICATLEPTGKSGIKALFKKKVFIDNALAVDAEAIHPFYKFVNAKFCQKAHALGKAVNPWTVDSEKAWESLIAADVDAIITNNPEGLIEYLKKN